MNRKTGISAALAAVLGSALILSSCDLDGLVLHGGDLTADEKAVIGLKTALQVGIDTGSSTASRVNGYLENNAIRIQLPEEAEQALATVEEAGAYAKRFKAKMESLRFSFDRNHGNPGFSIVETGIGRASEVIGQLGNLERLGDSLIKYMNRAAELTAPRSAPIFKGAITDMTIGDGIGLLNSPDSAAATGYLSAKTFDPLAMTYGPLVDSTLNLVPLAKYWEDFRNAYGQSLNSYYLLSASQSSWNKSVGTASAQVDILKSIPDGLIMTESLGRWTTEHALMGLFHLVGEEEKDIRRDPFGYVRGLTAEASEILKEVFGEIMKMEK